MKRKYDLNLLILSFTLLLFCIVQVRAQLTDEFAKVDIVTGLSNATNFKFAPDGRIFILDRFGEILIYKPDQKFTVSAGTLPVYHEHEDGLVGIAVDPDFETNNKIYLHYAPIDFVGYRVSRFSVNGDQIDFNSEEVIIQWNTSRSALWHSGGDMDFDSQGNLYIATGDNTTYGSKEYAPIDEVDSDYSAEKASSNTNDLRGKVLRIKPGPGTSYSIPAGNLFPPGTSDTRPEIYVMGARNPYRIFVDKEYNDWLFWGEVGPDANYNDPENPNGPLNELGPEGRDEINLTKQAGNYGWPYFSGADNAAYQITYTNPKYYNNPSAPENVSKWNTGLTVLPPAEPAWIEKFHKCYLAGFRYNYVDDDLLDKQRLPAEFDDLFFYFDFNTSRIWAVDMTADGSIISEELLSTSVFPGSGNSLDGYIDMELGPDGKMYILAYGEGCCPQDIPNGIGKLIQVNYTGITSNSPPTVVMEADVTNGALPLNVNFSGDQTTDPNDDSPLTYAWDIDVDGIVDYTTPNIQHTYNLEGTYTAQLKVTDPEGAVGAKTITIYAGNTQADFSFNSPVDGGFFNWNDDTDFNLVTTDAEDGVIPCEDVNVIPSLGHENHFHDVGTIDACTTSINLGDGGHQIDGEMDIFYVINTNYTDSGGLISRSQIRVHPKRREAEYFDTQNGVTIIPNTYELEGASSAIQVNNNSFISFTGRNLLNMNAVKYLVSSSNAGGSIELRLDSPTGTLVATTTIPSTGGNDNWQYVETPITNPGGKHDLYFVFKNSSVSQDIFRLNYVEFLGDGVSEDNTPPTVKLVEPDGNNKVVIKFSEYVNESTAENVANYTITNGVTVQSAVLQPDGQTVYLNTSQLSAGVDYNLSISNVQNTSDVTMATDSFSFFVFEEIRINVGGNQVTGPGGEIFQADNYFNTGSVYVNEVTIEGTAYDELYQSERYSSNKGSIAYEIPVALTGEYDIRLHFAELFFGVDEDKLDEGAGSRVFNVVIEGQEVLSNFDILAETDPATALVKDFDNVNISDGFASIIINGVVESSKINGIEILSKDTFEGGSTNADIIITSPSNGWDVNQPFEVAFRVENWVINEGDTHLHYYIDGEMVDRYYGYDPIAIDELSLGEHTIRVELFNADHSGTGIFDQVTVNVTGAISCNETAFPDSWVVHEFDENPYTVVYTFADDDLDGDGLKDIVTGGWWYSNPGSAGGNWERNTIGNNFGNVVHVYDFDEDGDMDLLGTALGISPDLEYESAQLLWAQNDGKGNFTVFNNIPAGDTDYNEPFLAGIAGGVFENNGPYRMAINWNGAESTGSPVQMLTPPSKDNVTTETWSLVDISNDSSGEDIQAGDIDRDGDLDLFQGVNWLRNNGNLQFETFSTGITYVTTPDRAQLADFDRDGDLDAVVGQLSANTSDPARDEFSWFAAPSDPTQPWTKNLLSDNVKGSLSVFAIDIDFDGDKDIVVGEWRGNHRLIAFENDLCGSGQFIEREIDNGALDYEHHDGARVVDIDSDGDLDVVSNGWLRNKVLRIYENTSALVTDGSPSVNAGEDQSVVPGTAVNLNGSGSDPDGGTVTFAWSQTSGPSITLNNSTSASATTTSLTEPGTYVFRLTVTDDEGEMAFDDVSIIVTGQIGVTNINAGGQAFSFGGTNWAADQYSNGGSVLTNAIEIANTENDQLYQTERYRTSGNLIYEIPVSNGTHSVNLHFAEIYFGVPGDGTDGGAGSRVFNIDIEGQGIKNNYDIFVAAGGAASAIVESFNDIEVNDGNLTITLIPVTENPKISGIEIVQPTSDSTPLVEAGENIQITLPNNSVVLTGTGSDPDGGPVSFLWEKVSGPSATLSGEDTAQLNLSNLQAGVYVFRLTVTDDENEFSSDQVSVTVVPENGLLAVIDATPNEGEVPLEVTFTGSNSMGEVSSYLWDFKDGQSSTDANPVHTFDNIGTYEVELTVTDMGGNQHTSQIIIAVLNIGEGNKLGLVIRKNPVTEGILGFRIDNEPDDMKILGVNLHDQQGKLVNAFGTSQITVKGDGSYEIIVDTLTDGLYFLRLALNTGDILNIKILVDN
ncbi:malectin domain-containing carbohydrate-binding protein [Cytophaga sp. FL35]|uniref:malectin domain-containing carbohydrate-binding protein n=1 Tax=Cytophaga sp. FL35 TaxID=1904456 RepID=UPI0016536AE8|nr:malectin domain-containing carbohydrate-binding protein [Cytophaga sp. FL35]MBC6998001.1 PQQ-dependent sugar dehydrogenase [Cytophaga sp. FL35]